jgi:hypothetical protein
VQPVAHPYTDKQERKREGMENMKETYKVNKEETGRK